MRASKSFLFRMSRHFYISFNSTRTPFRCSYNSSIFVISYNTNFSIKLIKIKSNYITNLISGHVVINSILTGLHCSRKLKLSLLNTNFFNWNLLLFQLMQLFLICLIVLDTILVIWNKPLQAIQQSFNSVAIKCYVKLLYFLYKNKK